MTLGSSITQQMRQRMLLHRIRAAQQSTTTSNNGNTPAYVHPLSQLVLQHLQTVRGEWVERQNLGLTIHQDGTFELKYHDNHTNKIWTTYERTKRQHWLLLKKDDLVGQYLLQDNTKPAWNDAKSTPEKIAAAVDAMIDRIHKQECGPK